MKRHTDRVTTFPIEFQEDPTSAIDPVDPRVADAALKRRALPVLVVAPNWAGGIDETFSRQIEAIDFDYGSRESVAIGESARLRQTVPCLFKTADAARALQDFFFRCRGRQRSFYFTLGARDIVFAVPPVIGGTFLICEGAATYDLFVSDRTYRNIAMRVPATGVTTFFGIQDAWLNEGVTTLQLDAPIPAAAVAAPHASWLMKSRFESDVLTMTWHTNQVAETNLPIISVFDTFNELTIAGLRVAIGGDYVTVAPIRVDNSAVLTITIGGDAFAVVGDFVYQ